MNFVIIDIIKKSTKKILGVVEYIFTFRLLPVLQPHTVKLRRSSIFAQLNDFICPFST